METLLEKRQSLHKKIETQQQHNELLNQRLNQFQALANIGTVSAMIAHEINNILTPLGNYAQLALNSIDDKKLVEKALKKTIKNSKRAAEILQSLQIVANSPSADKQRRPFKDIVNEVFSCIGRDFSKDGIATDIQIPDGLTVFAIPAQIQQVMMNLILNAREAMLGGGGKLSINARQEQQTVIIEISDTGGGIEKENIDKIFEPFFTTKTQKSQCGKIGSGLGLAFCAEVIGAHNGSIEVYSKPRKGTIFVIELPAENI